MQKLKTIRSYGFVLKKEVLTNIDTDVPYGELILEDVPPLPGIYDRYYIPSDKDLKPRSLFGVVHTIDACEEDDFIRAVSAIKKQYPYPFDAVLGRMMLFNRKATCVRIFIDDYARLPGLITLLKAANVHFVKRKKVKPYMSRIKVRKFFDMVEVIPDVYKDQDQVNTYYLSIPRALKWDEFEDLTISLKHSTQKYHFDAALVSIFQKDGMHEFVRIYIKNPDMEELDFLRKRFQHDVEWKVTV